MRLGFTIKNELMRMSFLGIKSLNLLIKHNGNKKDHPLLSKKYIETAGKESEEIIGQLKTSEHGLIPAEAHKRLRKYGLNEVVHEKRRNVILMLLKTFKNPLIFLLLVLGVISFFTKDGKDATIVIIVIVLVSVVWQFFQEFRASKAEEQLKAMVKTTATVIRYGQKKEVPINLLVPGDVISLSAGDMVPADVRIFSSKDLFVNQAALTGESLPVDKHAPKVTNDIKNPLELSNMCFMGTNVENGTATAIVVFTGRETYFGSLAEAITNQQTVTSFDRGIQSFVWLMIKFILIIVPLVFLINGLSRGDWLEAFLFALAVAIGLTPEMLPMIVTVNLSKGSIVMFKKKVIVKRLNSIQNFGAMDVLATDKTGTITIGKVILEKHIDVFGQEENEEVLEYAYINSYYQTGLKNILDEAVLKHVEVKSSLKIDINYKKIDEVTFDFIRRKMSVVVEKGDSNKILICKGAVEEMLNVCTKAKAENKIFKIQKSHISKIKGIVNNLYEDGFRVIAVGFKETPKKQTVYTTKDESDLILLGFIAFLDPPKDTASEAIAKLRENGVEVKILTGDNELVTKRICKVVGLPVKGVIVGNEIEEVSDEKLKDIVEKTTIFAKLLPYHKERIIKALQNNGHTVGFLGDGINDTTALKASDVGISVDTAVDIAKESSDIILLKKSLLVLNDGVIEGRRVFGNIVKYLKMASSSNFGNVLSIVGASLFLPFLPMLPLQILVNNMLYDFSQTTIPTDSVDDEYVKTPRKWRIDDIKRFMLYFGPISSIFDYATFFILIYFFHAWTNPELFHTGWFIESLVTQTLIIHIIRTNKMPFIQSRASTPLLMTTIIIAGIGIWLPFSPLAKALGFVTLPALYFIFLGATLFGYLLLTQFVKTWLVKKHLSE